MLFVLGAGSFAPEQLLTEQLLRELGVVPAGDGSAGLKRPTTLNLELLRTNKNGDLQQALQTASPTCTDMGEHAARQAIERAGISVDQIGLVLGDCATPVEVTPAEGQRVAGRLGLKVPAYDMYSCNGICPTQLSVLSTWKRERLPRYVLCVSTNAPTQRIDYSKGSEGWYFGDGASACVLSAEDCRGLELIWEQFSVDASLKPATEIDTLGYLVKTEVQRDAAREQARKIFANLAGDSRVSADLTQATLFWSLADAALQQEILSAVDVKPGQVVNRETAEACMLGSSSFYGLAQQWDSFEDGQMVGVLIANGTINYGGALFRVRKGA